MTVVNVETRCEKCGEPLIETVDSSSGSIIFVCPKYGRIYEELQDEVRDDIKIFFFRGANKKI